MPTIIVEQQMRTINVVPDVCPYCHHAVAPQFIASHLVKRDMVDVVFHCVRHDCNRAFIAVYNEHPMNLGSFNLRRTYPRNPVPPVVSKEISEVSPQFVEIYTQAAAAEDFGLSEIAGVGYRKALEFLMKDYAIACAPEKTEDIKEKFLGVVIDKYIDNENIKQCAKRGAWLGNDETHYVRKWEDKDINDLKGVIKLTLHWIEHEILTANLLKDMPS